MLSAREFLLRIQDQPLSTLERAVALLWWAGREDPTQGLTSKEICVLLELAGHPKQNVSRLESQLRRDRRTSRAGRGAWRLHPTSRRDLAPDYSFALSPEPPKASDSVLPRELFTGTRGYIERVVEQINKSYDYELWDCCGVMCRRLLETLIIETYEKLGRAVDIKGKDGHFLMFNGLITYLDTDASINLGRNATKGLRDHKALGDQSAHNRRFTATKNDVDRARDGLRIAAEELLHLAGLR